MVWQPGIRLFHSTDLANWSLVGHGLTEADHDLRDWPRTGHLGALPDLQHL